ncbi:histidinol-phosphate aminotransferase [Roseobacter sp. SK209-2-6]|uniref:peptidoglycan-binding protein n=1 Tax=Roseobacter sp. SK209-2-6 TaxID=388739 RepID=UPI0000F3D642|nr:peptidoglycan-binding protein [Roseobacter sp. SK209-2-6]EBA15780.1 histidinol-phosphate aminotransferase [Roseobacter sp. SK209-2-6]
MALKLSAPVGDTNRITKPDPKAGETKFKPVKNAAADVELVRLMLKANGFSSIEISKKCDASLIKDIRSFQKKALGFKKPDGIVDPGMRTWKAGLPKLQAMIAADQKVEVYEIKEGGQTKQVKVAEFEEGEKALKHEILSKARMMYGQAECWVSFCNDVEKTRQAEEGMMMAIAEFTMSTLNSDTDPPWTQILNAQSEAAVLKSLVNRAKPDWKKVQKQDAKATKTYNTGQKAFDKFIKARIGTAGKAVFTLEIVRETSFTIIEVYATARLMATKGMSPAKAHAVAAAGTEAMKSGAGQFGEYLAGNKVTWEGAAKKVAGDAFFAGLAGALGGKLTGSFLNGIATKVVSQLPSKAFQNFSQKALTKFMEKMFTTTVGQEMLKNAAKETVMLFKPVVLLGRPPSQKEVMDAVVKIVSGGIMSSGPMKGVSEFGSKYLANSQSFLAAKLAPNAMDAIVKQDLIAKYGADVVEEFAKKHGPGIYADVAAAIQDKVFVAYANDILGGSDGGQSAKVLQKQMEEKMRKDAKLRKEIAAMIKKQAEAKLAKLAKAR